MLALIYVYWAVQSYNLSSWRRHFLKTKEAPQSLLCMIHFLFIWLLFHSSLLLEPFPLSASYVSFYSFILLNSSTLCRYPGANLLNSCSTCVSFINHPQCSLTRCSLHRCSAALCVFRSSHHLFSANTFKRDFLLIIAAVINQMKIK